MEQRDGRPAIDPGSAKRLAAFPGGLEGALRSRCYWSGQPRPMFTKMSVISQVTGLDNTHLLPPYFPVFRGEDYLFGAMSEYIYPHSAVLEYDWSVPHMPLEEREGDPNPAPSSGKGMLNINKYITDRANYDRGLSPENRLISLAAMITELGEGDDRSMMSIYRKEVAEAQGKELAKLRNMLQDGTIRSPIWNDWLQQSANQISSSISDVAQISDIRALPNEISEEEAIQEFRKYAINFANSISAWTACRRASQEIIQDRFVTGNGIP